MIILAPNLSIRNIQTRPTRDSIAKVRTNTSENFDLTVKIRSVGNHRHTLQLDSQLNEDNTLKITFHAENDEKQLYEITFRIQPSRRLKSRGWKPLKVEGGQGFSAYRIYTIHPDGLIEDSVIIYQKPDTANFLSHILDDTPLGAITLPGTHESCSLYGYPISQCQQPATTIEQQLLDGIRFLDVRLRVVGDELLMYHGPRSQRSSMSKLLEVIHKFLEEHPSEFIILSIKQETPPWHPKFSFTLYQSFKPFLNKWFLEERIPKIGEVRGKGLLLTRINKFDKGHEEEQIRNGQWKEGFGIHPFIWPDSRKEGFDWDCAGTKFRTQDWYRVHTFLEIPEKFDTITNHLLPAVRQPTSSIISDPTFTLSFLSASYFPLSLPTIIAKGFGFPSWGLGIEGINSRMMKWLLDKYLKGEKVNACLLIDFYRQYGGNDIDNGLAELLIQMNFTGNNA
ncbi:uncharacterized protein L201_000915 [Kwoniella dendrophila CBS 6074]|uniref:Phosphatidylinositol-specific phospholipase C X domain-containing protein n=1 Tax=Kwoniella dendrophila CBS 6074 TaxID=1295534 RepID=A0AAX4JMD4_9TREE